MAERELRRMNRMELIEIIYALKQHEEELERQNANLRQQLADRTLRLEQVGSIAEAALSLNRVFEAAQAAADQYLESVKAQYPVQGTEFSPTANNEGAYWKYHPCVGCVWRVCADRRIRRIRRTLL